MQKEIPIHLLTKDETIAVDNAGFVTHFIVIANGFVLGHFLNPTDRKAYMKMITDVGFQGFPANIMKAMFEYGDPSKRKLKFNNDYVQPEQTGFTSANYEKVNIPFRNYTVEVTIYENVVFDPHINPYTQYVVTCNDFVVASFTHQIGALAYVDYLKRKQFYNFSKHVQDVIHYYADPSKRLRNERKEI